MLNVNKNIFTGNHIYIYIYIRSQLLDNIVLLALEKNDSGTS